MTHRRSRLCARRIPSGSGSRQAADSLTAFECFGIEPRLALIASAGLAVVSADPKRWREEYRVFALESALVERDDLIAIVGVALAVDAAQV